MLGLERPLTFKMASRFKRSACLKMVISNFPSKDGVHPDGGAPVGDIFSVTPCPNTDPAVARSASA